MYHYTYLIKFLPTGSVYYGKRSSRKEPHLDLWNNYFTSSKVVKQLLEDYGKDSFEYEIRKIFTRTNEALEWESKVLRRMHVVEDSRFLNQHYTVGNFISKSAPFKGRKHSNHSKDQIRQSVIDTKSKKVYTRPDNTIRNIKNGFNMYWKGKKNPKHSEDISGGKNGRAKRVITPIGNFDCIKDAAKELNIWTGILSVWIKNKKDGYYYG